MNQKDFQKLYEEYKDKITDADVKRDFDELYSISKENDVLLVTVVGSLKAGKSTFFNCIINENQDISETKPEECTIRPNFVIPSDKFAFRSYENVNKINIDINEILNYLCNEKNSNIEKDLYVRSKTEKDKLGDYVSQCQDASKSYLFTSFSLNSNSNFVKKLKDKKKTNFLGVLSKKMDTLKNDSKDFDEKISKLVTFKEVFSKYNIEEEIQNRSNEKNETDKTEDKTLENEKYWRTKIVRQKLQKYHEIALSVKETGENKFSVSKPTPIIDITNLIIRFDQEYRDIGTLRSDIETGEFNAAWQEKNVPERIKSEISKERKDVFIDAVLNENINNILSSVKKRYQGIDLNFESAEREPVFSEIPKPIIEIKDE